MTATMDNNTVHTTVTGRVVRVIGPVVDVEFPRNEVPELYNALEVPVEIGEIKRTLTLEIAQHLGDNLVRTISMQPTDGLVRGPEVTNLGRPISVPVGDQVKGHVFNALGECLDEPDLEITGELWGIHRKPPRVRPARGPDRDAGDRHQGASTCSPRTWSAARSACSAAPASARRCSSRR